MGQDLQFCSINFVDSGPLMNFAMELINNLCRSNSHRQT